MKKSADQYKRQATSKTGVINTNSLYKYKLTDDIFKRITTVPDGKNHGLVFHIDWSGSMTHVLLDTIKQTFNLVWFCRKAGIPFRVLAFQDVYFRAHSDDGYARFKAGDLYINDSFKMLELLSSQQNAKSLDESMKVIFMQVFAMGGYRVNSCQKYTLGGTPLAEAIM
ncbi:MAG: peptidase, partial [Pseudomonadota bacterium]|nr:peptidase [Pseudomonadota bacterium]